MVRPWALALSALLAAPLSVSAQDAGQMGQSPHTVIRGNTLWDLAASYCQNPFEWPLIYDANRETVENPHWIYPGENLQIACAGGVVATVEVISTDGDKTVVREVGSRVPGRTAFYPRRSTAETQRAAPATTNTAPSNSSDDESEEILSMAVTEDQFYQAEWLLDELGTDDGSGHIEELSPFDKGRGINEVVMINNRVRVRMAAEDRPAVGSELVAFRVERLIEGLGRVAVPTGRLTVTSVEDAGVVAVVSDEYERMALGDLIMPAPAYDMTAGSEPLPVQGGLEASILAFAEDRRVYSQGSVAFLDVGADQGVTIGDEFEVYAGGHDGWSPEAVAMLQVLRVSDNHASARIMHLWTPIVEPGQQLRLSRKMP